MKRELLENVKVQPYTSGDAIDREGYLSAVLGVSLGAATGTPTGITVNMQDEKSQIQNRAAALSVLKSRLLAMKHEQEAAEAADMRHSQVRSLDRSERIRTYNFPENRIVDHRTNYKAYNLDAVLDGDLQAVIDSDIQADEADRLANQK